MAEELHLRTIRDLAELDQIRNVWSSWQNHPNSDIDFYDTVVRSMSGVLRPHILVVYRGETPQAMLVGRLEHTQLNLKIGYKSLFKTQARVMTFIYKGYLGDASAENTEALVKEIMRSLGRKEADAAMLSNVSLDSRIYALGRDLPGFLKRDHGLTDQKHRSMSLPGNVEEVYRGLSAKVRKNLKWQAKKLVADFHGNVKIRAFRDTAEFDEMMRDLEQVAAKTYQRGLGVGINDGKQMRERLQLEAAKGWLRAFVLYIDDKPRAFWVGTLYQETFFSDFMGYDPEFGKYSPGMFLIMKVIEDFCEAKNGDCPRLIDFGFGDAQYKTVLANTEWRESSVYLFAPTLRGYGFNLLRTPTALANRFATDALNKMSLLPKIKRLWRNWVTVN